jgi:L-ornithine N5-oxygenase
MGALAVVREQGVHDVAGVGFGPANLALAVALAEHQGLGGRAWRSVFLERRRHFGWHPGMLVADATMQVSFLKDLATLRNPTSRFCFLSYLHAHGRLVDFINQQDFFPSRVEFHDYLEWAAGYFTESVEFDAEVTSVLPVVEDGEVVSFDVDASSGAMPGRRFRSRNLVLATGLVPRLPDGVEASHRVWHSSELLDRLAGIEEARPYRFAVVGAGQSAAEVVAHLHDRFRRSEIYAVLPRYGYSVADDTPFANQVFDPSAVDHFFESTQDVKNLFYRYHGNTNYSVVDAELVAGIYRRHYRERVRGRRRLHIVRMAQIVGTESEEDRAVLRLRRLPEGTGSDLVVDWVVHATGYQPMDPAPLLGLTLELCKRDSRGRLRVGRDYRVETTSGVQAGIYLQGGTEHTHGISSSLLSNISVRAGEIVESMAAAWAAAATTDRCRGPEHVRS